MLYYQGNLLPISLSLERLNELFFLMFMVVDSLSYN